MLPTFPCAARPRCVFWGEMSAQVLCPRWVGCSCPCCGALVPPAPVPDPRPPCALPGCPPLAGLCSHCRWLLSLCTSFKFDVIPFVCFWFCCLCIQDYISIFASYFGILSKSLGLRVTLSVFLRLQIGFFPSGLTVLFTAFFLTALCCILFPLIDFVVCLTEDSPSNFPPEKGCGR